MDNIIVYLRNLKRGKLRGLNSALLTGVDILHQTTLVATSKPNNSTKVRGFLAKSNVILTSFVMPKLTEKRFILREAAESSSAAITW